MPELDAPALRLTARQTQYLAFIREFTRLHDKAPAELEIAQYFKVSAPSVHGMLVKLEQLGAISRQPRTARSVRVLVPPTQLLDQPPAPDPASRDERPAGAPVVDVARAVVDELFVEIRDRDMDEEDFVPMLGAVARAAGTALLAAGRSDADATRARRAVLKYAAESYARVCAINDPEGADEDENTRRFWNILRESAR